MTEGEREKKRRRLSGKERRRRILDAAIRVFSQNGFKGTTVRDLARSAGISEATIYQHFPSKKALYEAILEQKVQEMREAWAWDGRFDGDDPAVFRHIVRVFLDRYTKDPTFIRIVLFSALEGHELARDFIRGPRARFLEILSRILQEKIDQGRCRSLDPEVGARLLVGMAYYVVLLREVFGEETLRRKDVDELSEAIVEVFWRGVCLPDFVRDAEKD